MPAVQIDAYLDPVTGDLPESTRLITGLPLIQQRIRRRLLRGQGEWFLDPSVGLPLIEWRQSKPPNVALMVAQVQTEIRQVPGVISTARFDGTHDAAARRVTITGDVIVEGGGVTSVVVSGSTDTAHNSMVFGVFFSTGNIAGAAPRPSAGRP